MNLHDKLFKKIPIMISGSRSEGWRAEIADNWEEYKPKKYEEINFEDIGFHFRCVEVGYDFPSDPYLFKLKRDAVANAKEVMKQLKGKAKIWHW